MSRCSSIRWQSFCLSCPVVNANDCLLTRMQEMSMDYHFKVEQEAGSSLCNFFGYNGILDRNCSCTLSTSAVFDKWECYLFMHSRNCWSMENASDCRVRGLGGPNYCWGHGLGTQSRALGLGIRLRWEHKGSQLWQIDPRYYHVRQNFYQTDPRLQFAFRSRVSCQVLSRRTGPSSIAGHVDLRSCSRKCSGKFLLPRLVLYTNLLPDMQWHENVVIRLFICMFCCFPVQKVSVWKKLYIIYDFFIARRIIGTFFTFFFFSVLIPLYILLPEAQIPVWELIYIPTAITLLNSVGTPRLARCYLS
jgi:hypothetical protein